MLDLFFRGKRKDNGEWVESGSIIRGIPDSDQSNYRYYIGSAINGTWYVDPRGNITAVKTNEECIAYEVDPETVCQFTGLTDKNGKKIYEGDIVRLCRYAFEWEDPASWEFETGVIAFEDGCFVINEIYSCDGYNELSCVYNEIYFDDGYDEQAIFEVIGNIYENPELLEADHG